MATVNVSLPGPMMEWIDVQARTGRYNDASDYVRDLIRRDQERASTVDVLQRLITEGLESGISDRSIDVLTAARAAVPSMPNP